MFQVTPVVQESDLRDFDRDDRKCLFSNEKENELRESCFVEMPFYYDDYTEIFTFNSDEQVESEVICEQKGFQLLRNYSQSGCLFECLIQGAISLFDDYDYGYFCLPWNFPSLRNSTSPCKLPLQIKIKPI